MSTYTYGNENWGVFGYKYQTVSPYKSNRDVLNQKLNQYLSNPSIFAPPIVDVVSGDSCHFIVVVGYSGDDYLVLDPGNTNVYTKQKISYTGKIVQYYK